MSYTIASLNNTFSKKTINRADNTVQLLKSNNQVLNDINLTLTVKANIVIEITKRE